MSTILITAPAVEPVTLFDAKLQCGLSPIEDTDHVKSDMVSRQLRRFITTARQECENRTRRAFITQTWKWQLDGWEHPFFLPKPPFQAIVTFNYIDTSGATQDANVYGYQLDPGSDTQPARLAPLYAQPWPPLRRVQNNVSIVFRCGYGATGATVPPVITQAILFLVHSYYDPTAYKNVDALVDGLLSPYVNRIS